MGGGVGCAKSFWTQRNVGVFCHDLGVFLRLEMLHFACCWWPCVKVTENATRLSNVYESISVLSQNIGL